MRLGGFIVVAVALLGACSSDAEPREPDPAPPTTSATPDRPLPTMPAQASEDSPEGAAAFVKHYVDVFNYAAATGDVDELSRLSSPDCTGCQKYIDLYRDTYAAGGYFKGGDWKIGELRMQSIGEDTYLSTMVQVDRGSYREAQEDPEVTDLGERTEVQFALKRDQPWRTHQLALGGD